MTPELDVLERVQQRILWLAVRIVDHANRERPQGEIKVGGHQASSASMVGIMTALWFGHLSGDDKVAVKPHASPVYHAIKYLTGELDASYRTRLRQLGGLQAYPSRTTDPDVADFSVDDHSTRLELLAEAGVSTVIVSLADVAEPDALDRLGLLVERAASITVASRLTG